MSKFCIRRFGRPQPQDAGLDTYTFPNEWQGAPVRRRGQVLTFKDKREAEAFKETLTPTKGTYFEVRRTK